MDKQKTKLKPRKSTKTTKATTTCGRTIQELIEKLEAYAEFKEKTTEIEIDHLASLYNSVIVLKRIEDNKNYLKQRKRK